MAERHPRMIVSTEGPEASGKTRFALTAPHDIKLLDFDFGTEGVNLPVDDRKTYDLMAATWQSEAEQRRYALDVMRRFVADFRKGIADKVRSLVVDTFTAAWSGQRFARSEDKYVEMETEFRSLIQAAYASPHTNVILIHHLRQDWARDSAGKSYKAKTWSREGMDGIAGLVQLALRQTYMPAQRAGDLLVAPARFEISVLKSRDNVGLTGQSFPGMTFPELCGMVCPAVDWSK